MGTLHYADARTACADIYKIDIYFTPGWEEEWAKSTEEEAILFLLDDGYNVIIGEDSIEVIEQ